MSDITLREYLTGQALAGMLANPADKTGADLTKVAVQVAESTIQALGSRDTEWPPADVADVIRASH